jgi:hypothetical protein
MLQAQEVRADRPEDHGRRIGLDRTVGRQGRAVRESASAALVALLGLMHLGIVRLVDIFGGRRRTDDRRIDNRAGGQLEPLRRQMPSPAEETSRRPGRRSGSAQCREPIALGT